MADISYDDQGLAYEFEGPSSALTGNGRGKRRPDLDIPKAKPPPPPPDLLDETVQRARAQMARRLLMGRGIGSTFLTGPMGLPGLAPTAVPGLAGA